jgi:hypothetical protein
MRLRLTVVLLLCICSAAAALQKFSPHDVNRATIGFARAASADAASTAESRDSSASITIKLCHESQLPADLKPPLVFRLPTESSLGQVCLVVDAAKQYWAMRDLCPPLGARISSTGLVDTEVKHG